MGWDINHAYKIPGRPQLVMFSDNSLIFKMGETFFFFADDTQLCRRVEGARSLEDILANASWGLPKTDTAIFDDDAAQERATFVLYYQRPRFSPLPV